MQRPPLIRFVLFAAAIVAVLNGCQKPADKGEPPVPAPPSSEGWLHCVGEAEVSGPIYGVESFCGVGAPTERPAVTYGVDFSPGRMTDFARVDWPDSILQDPGTPPVVYVAVTIGTDGHPMRACVTDSVVAELAEYVLAAAMQCQFSAGTREGESVLWEVVLPYGIN